VKKRWGFVEGILLGKGEGVHGNVVGWVTMIQAGRLQDQVPIRWIIFNLPDPSSCTMALGLTQPLTEMSTTNLPADEGTASAWGWQPYRHLWTDCLENPGASTSYNRMGLHGLLQG
jgi:hypothetical protein